MIIKKPLSEFINCCFDKNLKDAIIEMHSTGVTKVNKKGGLDMTFEVFVTDEDDNSCIPIDEFFESLAI